MKIIFWIIAILGLCLSTYVIVGSIRGLNQIEKDRIEFLLYKINKL